MMPNWPRRQLDAKMLAAERQHQSDHRKQAQHRNREELAACIADAGAIDHHTEHQTAERTRKHHEGGLDAGFIGRNAIAAIEEARQPSP